MDNYNFKNKCLKKYIVSMAFLLVMFLCCTSCGDDEAISNTGEKTSEVSATITSNAEAIIESTSAPVTSEVTEMPTVTADETALTTATEKETQTLTASPQLQTTGAPSVQVTQPPKPIEGHIHNWTKANYQEAAKCTTCGAIKGTKLIADFEVNNVKCTAQLNKQIKYTSKCFENENYYTTGILTFSDYSTFDQTYKHIARDGYVWQGVTVTYVYDDENAWNYGMLSPLNFWSYYDADETEDMDKENEYGYNVFAVNYCGKEYECWIDSNNIKKEWDYDKKIFTFSFRVNFNVPIGYDGIVIGTYDAENVESDPIILGIYNDAKILDVYNEKCVLYRLPAAARPIKTGKETTKSSWIFTDGGDHIIATEGGKVVKVPIDTSYLPQSYQDEEVEMVVNVKRTFRAAGEWILYHEYVTQEINYSWMAGTIRSRYSEGWSIIKLDGTCQQKIDVDMGLGSVAGYKDGYIYYTLLNGNMTMGQKEYQWLYKVRITAEGKLAPENLVVELNEEIDNDFYIEAWLEDDWVYYSCDYRGNIEGTYSYRVKIDGSVLESVDEKKDG